jgi:hypothetical protein
MHKVESAQTDGNAGVAVASKVCLPMRVWRQLKSARVCS